MKEKINFRFLFIGLLSILLTAVSFTLVFYSAFQEQVKEDLQNSAGIIAKMTIFSPTQTGLRSMAVIKCASR